MKNKYVFYRNYLIINTIIVCLLIVVKNQIPLHTIEVSPYYIAIFTILSLFVIIFSIKIYKINNEKKVNLAKSPIIGKIYEIEKVLDCFYIHKSNQKKGFRLKAQIVDESLKPISEKMIIHAWFREEDLEENHEPKKGYFKAKEDPNFPILGAIFLGRYFGKK